MSIQHDLNYYKTFLQTINDKYKQNVLGDKNYAYTTQGLVSPISGNEVINGQDPISGYNNVTLEDKNITDIAQLAAFQNSFLSGSTTNIQNVNAEIKNLMLEVFGVPPGDGVSDMIRRLDYNPNTEMLKYFGEETPEVKDALAKLNLEYDQNQISLRIFDKEQKFMSALKPEDAFAKLGADEKKVFLDVLNSYDELVTNYQSEVQNSGMRWTKGAIPEDGMIGDAFSDVNVAAMKLNKAKAMLTMLTQGMSAKDIKAYEKTCDYEIEFNDKLVDVIKTKGIGSPEANLLSAQAEASRRARLYIESAQKMMTSSDSLDQAVVAQWKRDGFDPFNVAVINDMQADILNKTNVADIQALYLGDTSKYAAATAKITSMKEKAMTMVNFNRDGSVSNTEIADLLLRAKPDAKGVLKIDGIELGVIKAALQANGVTAARIDKIDADIKKIDINHDGKIDFNEALTTFNAFDKSQGRAAFNDMMSILAVTQVDPAANPAAFTTIGTEKFFVGDYSTQDRAVLSTFLASNGRYVHTTDVKFEALDDFHDDAGNTVQQRSDWREYQYANWAQSHAGSDINEDNNLAWAFKTGSANVSGFLDEIKQMTDARTQMMADILEIGSGTRGSDWWNDLSMSYFETIRHESNIQLVAQRGGSVQDGHLMDMICEAIEIQYADYGNYHSGINVDINNKKDNVSGADKVDLKYFADNFDSYGTKDITYDANLVNQSLQQYYAMWGLRSALYQNINKITAPESALITKKFGSLMDIGDQMEKYLLDNKALGPKAKETDEYRALEEKWYNNYDLINGIIRGDESIDRAVAALGGISAGGAVSSSKTEDVMKRLQTAIINNTDDAALDFNHDGNVDSADYKVLRMVVGDRRTTSAFDAVMTQDSLNLGKVSMYSTLAKNTTNVNAHDKAIYTQLNSYFQAQSDVNNYMATNLTDSSFASDIEKQKFMDLANQVDELNEAVEFKLREKLNTTDVAVIDPDLKAKATKASNEMVLLSLGFSVEKSEELIAKFPPDFKITEALTDSTEKIVSFLKAVESSGSITTDKLATTLVSLIRENPDNIEDSQTLRDMGVSSGQVTTLLSYIDLGADHKVINAYMNMVVNGAPADKFAALDNYVKNSASYHFTDAQEDKFLVYLAQSDDAEIATTYATLVKNNATQQQFDMLDRDFVKQDFGLSETEDDMLFKYLTTPGTAKFAETFIAIAESDDPKKSEKLAKLDELFGKRASLTTAQKTDFFEYLTANSATSPDAMKFADTFLAIVNSNDPKKTEKLAKLEDLFNNQGSLSSAQKTDFFEYLTASSTTSPDALKFADNFLAIAKSADPKKAEKLAKLEDLFNNQGSLTSADKANFFKYLAVDSTSSPDAMKIVDTFLSIAKDTAATPESRSSRLQALEGFFNDQGTLTGPQKNTFFEYLNVDKDGNLASIYLNLLKNGASAATLTLLDEYAKHSTDFNQAQKDKLLGYLGNAEKLEIAKTYATLVINHVPSTDARFMLLEQFSQGNLNVTREEGNSFMNYLKAPSSATDDPLVFANTFLNIAKNTPDAATRSAKLQALEDFFNNDLPNFDKSQEAKFCSYLVNANVGIAQKYADLVKNGASPEILDALDSYATNAATYHFTDAQEEKFLEYLGGSKNANIAKSYVNLLASGASEGSLGVLDDIYRGSGSTTRVLTASDLEFKTKLDTIGSRVPLSGDTYNRIVSGFGTTDPTKLNSILDGILSLSTSTDPSVQVDLAIFTNRLSEIVKDPLRALYQTANNESYTKSSFDNTTFAKYPALTKSLLEIQSGALSTMSPTNEAVVQAKALNTLLQGYAEAGSGGGSGGGGSGGGGVDTLSPLERNCYNAFAMMFTRNGTAPTAAQSQAAVDLIKGDFKLADNATFMIAYGRLVAGGESTAASNLAEVARFVGNKSGYDALIDGFTNTEISPEAANSAHVAISFARHLMEVDGTNYSGISNQVAKFVVSSILDGKGGYSGSSDAGATDRFFGALYNSMSQILPGGVAAGMNPADYSSYVSKAVDEFGKQLYMANVSPTPNDLQRIISGDSAYRASLGLNNAGAAALQREIYAAMKEYVISQITAENAKAEPNQSRLSALSSQRDQYQAAIDALG